MKDNRKIDRFWNVKHEIFDLLPKKLSNHTSLLMSVITDYHMILGLTEIKY